MTPSNEYDKQAISHLERHHASALCVLEPYGEDDATWYVPCYLYEVDRLT